MRHRKLLITSLSGGAIMIMSLVLFENEFLNIVSISFTALILNELIMVALEITTWSVFLNRRCLYDTDTFLIKAHIHGHFRNCHPLDLRNQHGLPSRVLWLVLYYCLLDGLYPPVSFIDLAFVLSIRFAWKVAVIVAISSLPLYVIKVIQSRISPAVYSKLM